MVASTEYRYYSYTNNNAPQVNTSYGAMINILDACLVNGFNVGTVSNLTSSGTTVTATFGSVHNLKQYQVIQITGADQTEYNVTARILTVPSTTTITFELATAPSVTTATGTIVAKLPPLGWDKPFSATASTGTGGRAAYRSKNTLLSARPYLRVVDEIDPVWTSTYAVYAKVGMVEEMTDINTMSGVQAPYVSATPDQNWVGTGSGTSAVNGIARWYYARNGEPYATVSDTATPPAGNREWFIIGTGDFFYLVCGTNTATAVGSVYGFGKFNPTIPTDTSNSFLGATWNIPTVAANSTYGVGITGMATQLNQIIIQRKYDQSASWWTSFVNRNYGQAVYSGYNTSYPTPATINTIPMIGCMLQETTIQNGGSAYFERGNLIGIYWLLQSQPYPHGQIFSYGDQFFIALRCSPASSYVGQVVFRVG